MLTHFHTLSHIHPQKMSNSTFQLSIQPFHQLLMVNTFLTSADFAKSAKSLDKARLGKQRVEAFQILNLISDLKLLSNLLEIKLDPKNLKFSILQIFRAYKQLPCLLVVDKSDSTNFRIDKYLTFTQTTIKVLPTGEETCETKDVVLDNPYPELIRPPPQLRIFLNEEGEEVEKETTYFMSIQHDPEPSPSQRVVRVGFANHPAVRMWFWHETALKAYINAHIDEFCERGCNNTMERYEIPSSVSKPKWCSDPKFHQCHRAALLEKEVQRNEKPWYINKKKFVSAGKFLAYEWPEDKMD